MEAHNDGCGLVSNRSSCSSCVCPPLRHLDGAVLESLSRPHLLITDTYNALNVQARRKERDQALLSECPCACMQPTHNNASYNISVVFFCLGFELGLRI